MADRWHCFGCQGGGDAITFVQEYAQVGFREAVRIIEGGGPLPRGADPHLQLRPAQRSVSGELDWGSFAGSDREPRDAGRSRTGRLYDTVAVGGSYYTLSSSPPGLAGTWRRSLNLGALEAREGRPLGGTPRLHTGLVDHLRRHGFTDDEAVDAGLAGRHPNGEVADLFIQRMVLPVRGERDRVVGMIGRDVSGALRAKYQQPDDRHIRQGTSPVPPEPRCSSPGNISSSRER